LLQTELQGDGSSPYLFNKISQNNRLFLIGFGAGGFALCGSVIMVALSLSLSGQEFVPLAKFMVLVNLPVVLVEGLVAGFILRFLIQLKPELFSSGQNSSFARPAVPAEF
jgi:ABC-type Co2+ transport system permease subunit